MVLQRSTTKILRTKYWNLKLWISYIFPTTYKFRLYKLNNPTVEVWVVKVGSHYLEISLNCKLNCCFDQILAVLLFAGNMELFPGAALVPRVSRDDGIAGSPAWLIAPLCLHRRWSQSMLLVLLNATCFMNQWIYWTLLTHGYTRRYTWTMILLTTSL